MKTSAFVQTVFVPSRVEISAVYEGNIYSVVRKFSEFLGHPSVLGDFTTKNVANYLTKYRKSWTARSTNNQRQILFTLWQDAADRTELLPLLKELPNRKKVRKLPEELDPPEAWNDDQVNLLMLETASQTGMICGVPAKLWWLSLSLSIYDTSCRISSTLACPENRTAVVSPASTNDDHILCKSRSGNCTADGRTRRFCHSAKTLYRPEVARREVCGGCTARSVAAPASETRKSKEATGINIIGWVGKTEVSHLRLSNNIQCRFIQSQDGSAIVLVGFSSDAGAAVILGYSDRPMATVVRKHTFSPGRLLFYSLDIHAVTCTPAVTAGCSLRSGSARSLPHRRRAGRRVFCYQQNNKKGCCEHGQINNPSQKTGRQRQSRSHCDQRDNFTAIWSDCHRKSDGSGAVDSLFRDAGFGTSGACVIFCSNNGPAATEDGR